MKKYIKKLLFLFVLCIFVFSSKMPVYSMNFSENYPENTVCFVKLNINDLLTKILMVDLNSDKQFPTYFKKIDKLLKTKSGISFLNDVESVGAIVIKTPDKEQTNFKYFGFVNGKFDSKDTLQTVKEMLANPSNMMQTPIKLSSSGKNPKLTSDKVTIIHKDKKTLIVGNDEELLNSIKNKTLKVKKAPEALQSILKEDTSFVNLDPSSFIPMLPEGVPNEAKDTLKNLETIQLFFKNDNFNLKCSFSDANVTNSVSQLLNMLRNSYLEKADKTISDNEKALSSSTLSEFFTKSQEILSICKYKDFLNDITLKTENKDLLLITPMTRDLTSSALVVTGVAGIMAAMAVPNFQSSRDLARQKACFSNIRVMHSAVEMYNMDAKASDMMKSLDIKKLIDAHYLRTEPKCPVSGEFTYYSEGDLAEEGEVCCQIHGKISAPKPLK